MIGQFIDLWAAFPGLMFSGALVLLTSLFLMQNSIKAFALNRPTIPAVFYVTFIFMIFLPSFLVYRDNPGPFRDAFITSVILVMLTVPLGTLFINRILGYRYDETKRYFSIPPVEVAGNGGMYLIHFALALFMFLTLADYLLEAPVLPIMEFIRKTSDPMGLTLAREDSFKLLDPRWGAPNGTLLFYAYLFLRTLLFPFLIMTTLGYALFTRKPKWIALFSLMFVLGGFYAVSSLARAPISAIFMRIFFFLYLFFQARVSKKVVLAFGILMLAFPLIVTTFANSTTRTLWDGLVAVGIRLTYAPALDLYYYFEIFPAYHDYLYGHTFLKPIFQILGQKFFYTENFVSLYISPFGVKSAHSNAAFISNLHADFGIAGVLLGSFLCGAVMQYVHIRLVRAPKTILNMAIYSFMIYAIWVLNFGSVTSVLLVNGVLPVILLAKGIEISSRWISASARGLQSFPGSSPSAAPLR